MSKPKLVVTTFVVAHDVAGMKRGVWSVVKVAVRWMDGKDLHKVTERSTQLLKSDNVITGCGVRHACE